MAPEPAPAPVAGPVPSDPDVAALHALIVTSLDDDKAQELVSISLEGKSPIADMMVIASGTSSRQIAAMSEHLAARLKEKLGISVRITGAAQGDWVLIDVGDVIVHLFRPEVRSFYNLEKMWSVEVGASQAANRS